MSREDRESAYEPLVPDESKAPAFQTFDDFAQDSVIGVPVAPVPEDVEQRQHSEATRFINIPELPSASAEWHSTDVSRVFGVVMVASILLMLQSFPLAFFLLGVPGVLSSIVGIIMASIKLFEGCQSSSLDADVTVITILANICIALDAFVAFIFIVFLRVVTQDADVEFHFQFDIVFIFVVYAGMPLLHLWAVFMARSSAIKLKNIMRPIRSGMVVMG